MRLRQVVHVDVVADTGAVRRIVIVTENRDRPARRDGSQHEWNQVRFRVVLLAQPPFGIGAGGVEVTQGNARQVVNLVEPAQQPFHHRFGFAVRVHGLDGEILPDRRGMGIAIHRRRGREHDVLHARLDHGGEQRERAAHVVLEVARRLAHRFADLGERGEMDGGVKAPLAHEIGQSAAVREVQLVQSVRGDVVTVSFREIVHHRNVVALLEQQAHRVGADVTSPAGNQDSSSIHKASIRL